jgi:protein-L-isoaspartate O-methyltransferase
MRIVPPNRSTLEGDYILGTNDEKIRRLGLQHHVWRPFVLATCRKVGIRRGSRVLDLGAGPEYATIDFAEIVGPHGQIIALERSRNFVDALNQSILDRGLTNVEVHQLDLMTDELPEGHYDFAWCRWVAMFVADPAVLITKLAAALPGGSIAIFHEYAQYSTWRFSPRLTAQEEFIRRVTESWRINGGYSDVALRLPALLVENGFAIRATTPLIFCLRRSDEMWHWPITFIRSGLVRLEELGLIDRRFVQQVECEVNEAERNENSLMITPLVLEIVAEKLR